MKELLKQSLGAEIMFELELAPDLPAAVGNTNSLNSLFLNLSLNARDAMPDSGTLKIATAAPALAAKSRSLAVTELAPGCPPTSSARAFDPFFTTKPTGKGTGLGLSQVYGIVRRPAGT